MCRFVLHVAGHALLEPIIQNLKITTVLLGHPQVPAESECAQSWGFAIISRTLSQLCDEYVY